MPGQSVLILRFQAHAFPYSRSSDISVSRKASEGCGRLQKARSRRGGCEILDLGIEKPLVFPGRQEPDLAGSQSQQENTNGEVSKRGCWTTVMGVSCASRQQRQLDHGDGRQPPAASRASAYLSRSVLAIARTSRRLSSSSSVSFSPSTKPRSMTVWRMVLPSFSAVLATLAAFS